MFILQVVLGRRQQRDLLVFESSCHLPSAHLSITHGGGFIMSLYIAERQAGKLWIPILYSLRFDPTGNHTKVYCFSSRHSIHLTTDRLTYCSTFFSETVEAPLEQYAWSSIPHTVKSDCVANDSSPFRHFFERNGVVQEQWRQRWAQPTLPELFTRSSVIHQA